MPDQNETRLMLQFMAVGYTLTFSLGLIGSFFSNDSFPQITCWQIGDSLAIMASILAGRYLGLISQNIASSGFTLLAIAYGVSVASSGISGINSEKMATIILPLVPAIFLISFCKIFPQWVRIASLLICIPFFLVYKNVVNGTYQADDLENTIAFSGIQIFGLVWSYVLIKHFRKTVKAAQQ